MKKKKIMLISIIDDAQEHSKCHHDSVMGFSCTGTVAKMMRLEEYVDNSIRVAGVHSNASFHYSWW